MTQNTYSFNSIFKRDENTDLFSPRYDVMINRIVYKKKSLILNKPTSFGGITFYDSLVGRDVVGRWNKKEKYLEIIGFYN